MSKTLWWQREDLSLRDGVLSLAGQSLDQLAADEGTPLYVYSMRRVRQKLGMLNKTLAILPSRTRLYYAMKSNRHRELLQMLAATGEVGIDACSPAEVQLAMECGFPAARISFTGYAVSPRDWDQLLEHEDLRINCDGISALREVGKRASGRSIGLRIDPALGIGYRGNALVEYSGTAPAKFGVREEDLPRAIEVAADYELTIEGLHCHAGCGYLDPQLEQWETLLERIAGIAALFPDLSYLNLGGGLGTPRQEGDQPLDLERWARSVGAAFAGTQYELCFEPGDFLVKDCGVLILEVASIDDKAGVRFIGLNGGFNLHPEPAYYGLPLPAYPTKPRQGTPERVTLAGNINEALDVWAREVVLPPLEVGDHIALLHAGGYGAAMASSHCLRGAFKEVILP